jgi:hypothetical protein
VVHSVVMKIIIVAVSHTKLSFICLRYYRKTWKNRQAVKVLKKNLRISPPTFLRYPRTGLRPQVQKYNEIYNPKPLNLRL